MIILDTNVLSELLRPEPARQVERWLSAQDGAKVYFTTVGEAELRHGVAILPAGKRRNALTTAIEGLLDEEFRDRVLPFDRAAARAYATIAAARRAAGRPISQFDCQIAAIALGGTSRFPVWVFLGTSAALILTSLLGVILGQGTAELLPSSWIKIAAAIGFSILGVKLLWTSPTEADPPEEESQES